MKERLACAQSTPAGPARPANFDADVTEEDQRLALLAAEPDLRLDDWSALVGAPRRHFEVVERAVRSISWVACKPPMLEKGSEGEVTLEEVDQLFRLALTTSWCKCGDDHAHGVTKPE